MTGDMSSSSSPEPGERVTPHKRVFLCYSHQDRHHASRLRVHFNSCRETTAITCWDDTQLQAGSLWEREIAFQLSIANFVILLISADFLASSFITAFELPHLLSAAQSGGTRILPVIIGYCIFKESSLAQFQAINDPARPLNCLTAPARDKVWVSVVRTLLSANQ